MSATIPHTEAKWQLRLATERVAEAEKALRAASTELREARLRQELATRNLAISAANTLTTTI